MSNRAIKKPLDIDFGYGSNPSLSADTENSSLKGLFSVNGQFGDRKGTKKKFSFMAKKYSWSKIYKGKTGAIHEKWFVYYSFINPITLKFQRIKVYEGINYCKSIDDKENYAMKLCDEIDKQLKAGYNPFESDKQAEILILQNEREFLIKNQKSNPCISDGFMQFMHQKTHKNRSKQTIQSYNSYIVKFHAYLLAIGKANMKVSELTTEIIVDMMKWIEKEYRIGNRTYNNHITFLITVLNWFAAKPRKWINMDDFDFGTDTELEKKTSRPEKHTYFTENAMQRMKDSMNDNPNLLFYAKFIYYSCMRPDEVRNLKIENIDRQAKIIRIVGKTDHRVIPICEELSEMILDRNIDNFPMSHYLIGKEGEVNSKMHSENYYSKMFRELRYKAGLTDKFTLYGLKHTRVIHLSEAGYRDAEIMQLTGHTSTESYDKYKRDLMGNLNSKLKGKLTVSW